MVQKKKKRIFRYVLRHIPVPSSHQWSIYVPLLGGGVIHIHKEEAAHIYWCAISACNAENIIIIIIIIKMVWSH